MPSSSQMCSTPSTGPADGAGMGQPVLRPDVGQAVELRAAVVLVDDRPPPLEHRFLDRPGAGSGGVDGHLVRREVEAVPVRPRGASACGRTSSAPTGCACSDAAPARPAPPSGSKWAIRTTVAPDAGGSHAEAQRRSVVDRGGGEVDAFAVDAEQRAHPGEGSAVLEPSAADCGRTMPFGRPVVPELYSMSWPSGSSSSGSAGHGGECVLIGVVAVDHAVDREAQLAAGDHARRARRPPAPSPSTSRGHRRRSR